MHHERGCVRWAQLPETGTVAQKSHPNVFSRSVDVRDDQLRTIPPPHEGGKSLSGGIPPHGGLSFRRRETGGVGFNSFLLFLHQEARTLRAELSLLSAQFLKVSLIFSHDFPYRPTRSNNSKSCCLFFLYYCTTSFNEGQHTVQKYCSGFLSCFSTDGREQR